MEVRPLERVGERCSLRPIWSMKRRSAARMSCGVWPSRARIRRLMMPLVMTACVAVGLEPEAPVAVFAAEPHAALASFDKVAIGLVFFVDDGTFFAEVDEVGVFVEPLVVAGEFVDDGVFYFLYGHIVCYRYDVCDRCMDVYFGAVRMSMAAMMPKTACGRSTAMKGLRVPKMA